MLRPSKELNEKSRKWCEVLGGVTIRIETRRIAKGLRSDDLKLQGTIEPRGEQYISQRRGFDGKRSRAFWFGDLARAPKVELTIAKPRIKGDMAR